MSISVLIFSILAALGQAALGLFSLRFLSFYMPMPVAIGCIFAEGILFSFILIFIIGSLNITSHAADFVKDNLGRFLLLMLCAMVLMFGLGTGFEAIYENRDKNPLPIVKKGTTPDVVFVMDYSSSMGYNTTSSGEPCVEVLRDAFRNVANTLRDGQRISIVQYTDTARVLQDWVALDRNTRADVISRVDNAQPTGGTNYRAAIQQANKLVRQALDQRHGVVVIMLSDGEGGSVDIAMEAPDIAKNNIPVYTMGIGSGSFDSLEDIAKQTGVSILKTAIEAASIASNLQQIVVTAVQQTVVDLIVPDTILSPDYDRNIQNTLWMVIHIALLLILSFAFRLIVNICIGNNAQSWLPHIISSFVASGAATAAIVYLGHLNGLELLVSLAISHMVYWLLMMTQIVIKSR